VRGVEALRGEKAATGAPAPKKKAAKAHA